GTNLSAWAQKIAPEVYLVRAAAPVVTSIVQPDNSLSFDIRIAEILPSSVNLFNYYVQNPAPQSPAQQAANASNMPPPGSSVVPPPPAPAAPPPTSVKGSLNPNQQYSDYVRDAIIDAIVDAAIMLPIAEGQTLTVHSSPVNVAVQNPLY